MTTSEEEEELTTYEDESGRKKKQRRGRGNLETKRKLKEGKRNRRMQDSEQTDITKDEWSDKEEVTEETGGRRRQEVGKDHAIKGARTEAKYEQELNGMTPQEIKDYGIMLTEDAETVRLKTKNMQGGLSGILKDRLLGLRNIIECMID